MHKRTRMALLVGVALAASAEGVANAQVDFSGAPLKAEVELTSSISQIPPDAYALSCFGLSDCTATGLVEVAIASEVPVARDPAAGETRGAALLEYTNIQGAIRREVSCKGAPGAPYVSTMTPNGSKPGELEVTSLKSEPGSNTIAATLKPSGTNGQSFPLEIGEHVMGGCGVAPETYTLDHPLWYSTFNFAHQDEWPEDGSEGVVVKGLAWNPEKGAFVKEYDRMVSIQYGPTMSSVRERTSLEVRPEFCKGEFNRIDSATADGQSLGLDGMPFYAGQVITLPKFATVKLADGSIIQLGAGGMWKVAGCAEEGASFALPASVRKFWAEIKKTLSGSERKFEIRTDRAVAGVRGTKYMLSYDKAKQLTRVAVKEGAVELRGINGAKGKVLIRAGRVGVQQGRKRPRLLKR